MGIQGWLDFIEDVSCWCFFSSLHNRLVVVFILVGACLHQLPVYPWLSTRFQLHQLPQALLIQKNHIVTIYWYQSKHLSWFTYRYSSSILKSSFCSPIILSLLTFKPRNLCQHAVNIEICYVRIRLSPAYSRILVDLIFFRSYLNERS